jgi:drug/metabolite transporter (DMT)-like permease
MVSGAFFALISAALFGMGDFAGGLAARRISPAQVLALSSTLATLLMAAAAVLSGEAWPTGEAMLWSGLAGICGAVGLASLYLGLAVGRAAVVSPVSGVVAALIPVLAAGLSQGLPETRQLAGFVVALPGIWLVSSHSGAEQRSGLGRALGLGIAAGLAFGCFFIFLDRVPEGGLFGPMAAVKGAAMIGALVWLAASQQSLPQLRGNPAAWLAGVFDPSANTLYFLATRLTRLDIAAVLSSLYPAVTVLCSRIILKEKISPAQWAGLVLCVGAIALITS